MLIPRYSETSILQDLAEKMVLLSGPRQVGKTTLAKSLLRGKQDRYFNWDNRQDRRELLAAFRESLPPLFRRAFADPLPLSGLLEGI